MNMRKICHIIMIIFLTALLCACFMYDERAYDNPYDPDASDGVQLAQGTMQIDADTSDWENISSIRTDNTGELSSSGNSLQPGSDFYEFKMVQDNENIYFYYSTIDGSPLITPGMNFHNNFRTDDYNIQFNFAHNYTDPISNLESAGTYGWWSNYDYEIDEETRDNISIENTPIRFAGVELDSNSLEFAISKSLYWDYIEDEVLLFDPGSWSSLYDDQYQDGSCDNIDDINELNVLVKDPNAEPPSTDVPIMQFNEPSSALSIDGLNTDLNIWEETGVWFQDFIGDDLNLLSEPNTDIDKIYVKQDSENVYFLITFADPGPFRAGDNYYFDIRIENGLPENQHTFYTDSNDGANWTTNEVQYDVISDGTNCIVAESDGYLELQFDKTVIWDMMPITTWQFNIEVRDNSNTVADKVYFAGSHKSSTDPTPSP